MTPGRWATIKLILAGEDMENYEREQVINISMTVPPDRPPELPGLEGIGSDVADRYFLERVPEGVQLGMVRGGTVRTVGSFGFPPVSNDVAGYELRETGGFELREDGSLQERE